MAARHEFREWTRMPGWISGILISSAAEIGLKNRSPSGPSHQFPTTVWTDILHFCAAFFTKCALVGTYPCDIGSRQLLLALFTLGFHLQGHGSLYRIRIFCR